MFISILFHLIVGRSMSLVASSSFGHIVTLTTRKYTTVRLLDYIPQPFKPIRRRKNPRFLWINFEVDLRQCSDGLVIGFLSHTSFRAQDDPVISKPYQPEPRFGYCKVE